MILPTSTRATLAGVFICGLLTLALSVLGTGTATGTTLERGCNLSGKATDLGTTYVTSLKVRGTGCDTGKKVIKKFNKCRHQNGGKNGHCDEKQKGFNCKEGRRSGVPGVQYSAHVKCRKDAKTILFNYTQDI